MYVSAFNSALSLQIARNVNKAAEAVGSSLERLGSGKRIIRASDNVGDMARITQLKSQGRGISQAILNVNDTLGLTYKADTTVNGLYQMAYALRELAQKATDSSLTSEERNNIEDEASAILSDFTDYVSDATYNDIALFDGTFSSMQVQAGPNNQDTIDFELGDARTATLGRLAIYSGTQGYITNAIGGGYTLSLNGVAIAAAGDDDLSSSNGTYSGVAVANAINAQTDSSGVSAEALDTVRTLYMGAQGTFTQTLSSGEFKINDVSITGTSITTASAFVSTINGFTSSTGVVASVDGSGNVVLTATDGRNIQVVVSNGATNNLYDWVNISTNSSMFSSYTTLSTGSNQTHIGGVKIWSSNSISISGTNASLVLGITSGTKALSSGVSLSTVDLSTETSADTAVKVLDATIAQISTLRAKVGAIHDRLDVAASYLVEESNGVEEARSALEDVDFAEETLNLVVAQLLQDSSLASLTQANVQASAVMRLLSDL